MTTMMMMIMNPLWILTQNVRLCVMHLQSQSQCYRDRDRLILGAHWPTSLVYSVSSRSTKTRSMEKVDNS